MCIKRCGRVKCAAHMFQRIGRMRCRMLHDSRLPHLALAALLMSCALPGWGQVKAQDAWVRGTVPGQDTTAAYMRLQSTTDVVVTGATSPVAKLVELHSMSMAGGIMKMRGVPRLVLAAGKPVELTPS